MAQDNQQPKRKRPRGQTRSGRSFGCSCLSVILLGILVVLAFFFVISLFYRPSASLDRDNTAESSQVESSLIRSPETSESEGSQGQVSASLIEEESPEEAEGEGSLEEGPWDPIGTEQEGPHVTDYSDGSQDRIEIRQAVLMVTDLDPDLLIEHWIGNDGSNQGVYATVSENGQPPFYRVHLRWVDGEGWQPLTVETQDAP